MSIIHSQRVNGIGVDGQTRCIHYKGERDIIAIKFACCRSWYPCIECHAALADHTSATWLVSEREAKAILCGNCGHQLSITEYFACETTCPRCKAGFNPGCANHYHLYFESY